MANRPFSQAESEFLKVYVGSKPTRWIAERLGRSPHSINRHIRSVEPELWRNRRRVLTRRARQLGPGERLCRRCERVLPASEFYANRAARDGLQDRCKRCSVELATQWNLAHYDRFRVTSERSRRRRKYGLEPEAFDAIICTQAGRCPICLEILDGRIDVDHDHGSGRVRGLLHFRCNAALGALHDSIESLERAIAYLKQE